MTGELNLYGVFVPALFLWMLVAFGILLTLRRIFTRSGAYALVWHRPLVDVALYVIILGIVVYLSIWFTK
jgi:Protein of unknown function (DUF1656)